MSKLRWTALAFTTIGALAVGSGVRAWNVGDEPTRPGADRARRVANVIEGQWQVVYMSGTVNGGRQGFTLPGQVVPITEEEINLPTLTGRDTDPMRYRGSTTYLATTVGESGYGAMTIRAKPGAGAGSMQGIFKLSGEFLTICYDETGQGQPTAFADRKASENLIVLRRVPPATVPAPPPTTPPPTSLPGR